MLNQITFEQVKRNLISEKTQKRTNNPDVLAIFLSILVLYTNNMNQERNTDWYWETFIKHIEPLRWAVYFQLHLCKLGPPNLLPNVISLFLLIKHPLLLSFFSSHFSPYPSPGQDVGESDYEKYF